MLAVLTDRKFDYVVILGSGASSAVTKGQFPTDPNFLEKLVKAGDSPYLNPEIIGLALAHLEGLGKKKNWFKNSFETVWSQIDDAYNQLKTNPVSPLLPEIQNNFAEMRARAAAKERDRGSRYYYSVREGNPTSTELLINAGWECLQAVLTLLGQLPHKTDLDRFFKRLPFLKDTPTRCAVIDFNYDLTFETACKNSKVDFVDFPVDDSSAVKGGGILVLKPHGSVNWVQRIGAVDGLTESINRRTGALPPAEAGYEAPGHRYFVQPMIIGLRPKHEHGELSSDRRTVDLFRDIREACVTVLAGARELSIVGYRFPPADLYFRRVIMDATAAREQPLERLSFVGRDGDNDYWETLLNHLFWVRSKADICVDLGGF